MRARSAIAVFAVLFAFQTASARPTPQQIRAEVASRVLCTCGCLDRLDKCSTQGCEMKKEEYALIDKEIKEGKTEPQILQDFVQKYGVKVLPAPPAKGFNLTAWILPGVGLLFGLIIAVDVARRWRKPATAETAAEAQIDPHLLAAVEDEMKKTTS